ncbi:S1 family peptidase [Arthrobacter nitrophenolicus]|uniref:Peptidase n=1 Tax=Arthrobacter nitrophenolicus TaxID=683150 RepID=A0A4R5XZ79_9MICC|nr:S1 family peptidase [Arthrobacter nitrophenolicus]TDL37280.1 peptidase [Arthrobacter nitrophenolicus]
MRPAHLRRFLSLGAVAGMLASSAYAAAPAWAEDQAADAPSVEISDGGKGLSEAALAEAVQRDLGLTQEQFAAAGELGSRAAAAAVQLRDVPGYQGIRLEDGRIVVTGSGAELLAQVAGLAASVPELVLEAPAPEARLADPGASTAPGEGAELAVSTEQLFQAYVREVGPEGLQAVLASGGKFVIRTGGVNTPESTGKTGTASVPAGSGKVSPAEFVAKYANVELDGGASLAPEADVPGGVGYIADTGWICSTGFSAFNPAGLPAVLSAGHCASDGAARTATLQFLGEPAGLLGDFGFSQYGGPGNSRVLDPTTPTGPGGTALTDPGNVGTDISVIESLRADVDPLPAASTWGDPSQPEPDVKIIGSADPVLGMPVCRSGRTSFWSCGTIDAVGIFIVPGHSYAADPTDLRAFRGFLSYAVQSSGGDSGGPYVSGNYAVGTHAAGDTPDGNGNVVRNMAIAATLSEGLAVLPGYQLELFLNKPAVTSPAPGGTFEPGQQVTGTVPAAPASAVAAGSTVRITLDGGDPFEVPVDDAGNWSFTAPESTPGGSGKLQFTAETVNGFSASGTSSFEFGRAPAEPPAPPAPAEPAATLPAPAPTGPVPASPAPADPAAVPPADPSDGGAAVVPSPAGTPPAGLADTSGPYTAGSTGGLAYTGASALLPAAGAALAALAAGILLTVLVRRRNRRRVP